MIANDVTRMCVEFFERNLPKGGKPVSEREWTVLSAIVQEMDSKLDVVSMGTGTKCLGADQMSESGDVLNDSHAEIVTRRAFLRYLMEQMVLAREKKRSIFAIDGESGKFSLQTECKFHFFTTHSPCGDASIFPRNPATVEENVEDEPAAKRARLPEDNFTGGKLIGQSTGDLMDQTVGCVRTKPGRGVATLSASCSDKMARWCVMGLQGGLLMNVLTSPIYLSSVIYPRDAILDKKATERALWGRFTNHLVIPSATFHIHRPDVLVATEHFAFPFIRHPSHDQCQPCPASVVWSRVPERPHEVAVAGRRQGVTRKKLKTPVARLLIAKGALFDRYTTIFTPANTPRVDLSYQEAKDKDYTALTQWLRQHYFKVWPTKGEKYLKFTTTN
ncbi:tRNA-specific adenosine deaminase 1 [Phlebotomus argentipes]|uniref:tRNA-specific adenosine deaminase 1 n=1 Tax=Phlebotomus argentipes TaxID=94469 RepID=UPI0028937381|nr:tRNA-specific adenosine deaminase 1 [Phlebotomus argentipes]